MPVYEYECAACGHQFEEWQKISDPPVKTCPKCKKKKVERLISRTAFQLKGGGWYKDLYSSPGGGGDKGEKGEKSESKSETKSESKSETKSESKSETKSESKPSDSKPAKGGKGAAAK